MCLALALTSVGAGSAQADIVFEPKAAVAKCTKAQFGKYRIVNDRFYKCVVDYTHYYPDNANRAQIAMMPWSVPGHRAVPGYFWERAHVS